MQEKPYLQPLIEELDFDGDPKPSLNLLLDPTTCPSVISLAQDLGDGIVCDMLYLARTWCYMHHMRRRRLLKLYNII